MTSGWMSVSLGEAFKTMTGNTPPKSQSKYYGGTIPFVKPPELKDGPIKETADGLSNLGATVARVLPKNSILVSCIGNLGKVGISDGEVAFNQQINAILPNEEKALPKFMYYQMISAEFKEKLESLASGTTIKIVNKSKFNSIEVVLPPLPEQKRIVAILDEAFEGIDTAIANAEQNLLNARELFESYLNSIFSTKIEGWVNKPLSVLCSIKHGFAFKGKNFSTDEDERKPIVITPGNFTEYGHLCFTPKNTKRYSGDSSKDFKFDKGDLVIVMTDLSSKMKILGKPAFIESENILHNQRIGKVNIIDGSLNPRFLYYYFMSKGFLDNIKATATGTMVRHTAPKRILGNEIPIPISVGRQKAITDTLDALTRKTRRLEEIYQLKLLDLEKLKQSILHKAFSGGLTQRAA